MCALTKMTAMTKLNKIDEIKKAFILFSRFSTSYCKSEDIFTQSMRSDLQTETDRPDNHHDTFILSIGNVLSIE